MWCFTDAGDYLSSLNYAIDENLYFFNICICDENLKLSSDMDVPFVSYSYNTNILFSFISVENIKDKAVIYQLYILWPCNCM